jgi:hypothetical protein
MITLSLLNTTLLRGPVSLSHLFMRSFLHEGDRAIDATCGNGSDTLLLAELVGPSGRVWAFDIQKTAIDQTTRKLAKEGLTERVNSICAGHETLTNHVSEEVSVVVFNLGYLPGGDRSIITRPETTITALEASLNCLKPGGILAMTVYPGHDGGLERHNVDSWAAKLDERMFHVWHMGQINVPPDAPYFMLIQKAV